MSDPKKTITKRMRAALSNYEANQKGKEVNEFDGYKLDGTQLTYTPPTGAQVCANCRFGRRGAQIVVGTGGTLTLVRANSMERECRYTLPPWQHALVSDWCKHWEEA